MRKVMRVLKYVGYDIMDLSALAILVALGMLSASKIAPVSAGSLVGPATTVLAFAVIGFIPTAVLLGYVKICRKMYRPSRVYFVNMTNDRADDVEDETEETSEETTEEETPLHEVSMDEENIDEDQPFEE